MSDPFKKYKYPETDYKVLRELLTQDGFIQRYEDKENIYFIKGEVKVILPKEPKIVGLTIHDIVNQSRIEDSEFRKRLDSLNSSK